MQICEEISDSRFQLVNSGLLQTNSGSQLQNFAGYEDSLQRVALLLFTRGAIVWI